MSQKRIDGRAPDEPRKIKITPDFLSHPIGSVLIEVGGTRVICAVTFEPGVPGWMRAQGVPGGWVTSEYGLLPSSTNDRVSREASKGKQSGRTMEIQRLIGRSFRSVIDMNALGQNTVYIDCDVIDADGGTRCASICGASVALQLAFRRLAAKRLIPRFPMRENVAAISVGMLHHECLLDLCYEEDSAAEVDMNVVMTEGGKFVEIQGTAEENPFSREELNQFLDYAGIGLKEIFEAQRKALEHVPMPPPPKPQKGANLGSIGDAFAGLKL